MTLRLARAPDCDTILIGPPIEYIITEQMDLWDTEAQCNYYATPIPFHSLTSSSTPYHAGLVDYHGLVTVHPEESGHLETIAAYAWDQCRVVYCETDDCLWGQK
jgi:hypothetical protein